MLKITKQIQLTATSKINGEQVVFMSATLNSNGNSAVINKSITNKELYELNKKELRKDMNDFDSEVFKLEDEMEVDRNVQKK